MFQDSLGSETKREEVWNFSFSRFFTFSSSFVQTCCCDAAQHSPSPFSLDALHSILIILHFVSLLVSPLILHSSTLSSRLCRAARTFASHCRLNSSFNLDKEKQSQNNVGVIIVVVSARVSLLRVAGDEGGSEAALARVSSYLSRLCVKLRKSSALR